MKALNVDFVKIFVLFLIIMYEIMKKSTVPTDVEIKRIENDPELKVLRKKS